MRIEPIRKKWKSEMTDRERFNRQMHYQSVDRCFNMEFGYWDENFKQWDMFVRNNVTNNDEADIFFAFDTMHVIEGKTFIYPLMQEKVIEIKEDKKNISTANIQREFWILRK